MAHYVSPEQRAKIISAIKDDGMSVIDAAKTFSTTEEAITKWMTKQAQKEHASSNGIQRLKKENQELMAIIKEMKKEKRFDW
jgi:transposase-like protein